MHCGVIGAGRTIGAFETATIGGGRGERASVAILFGEGNIGAVSIGRGDFDGEADSQRSTAGSGISKQTGDGDELAGAGSGRIANTFFATGCRATI